MHIKALQRVVLCYILHWFKMAGGSQDLDPANQSFWEKKAELSWFMQGKSICIPSITWSPLLSRVSAPLRDAIHALVTSCNNIRMQQIQRSVWKTVSFKPLCLTAVVTGHKGGRKGNIKQGFVAKIRSCGAACTLWSTSISTKRLSKKGTT